ncbi:MAG: chemotaxis protein CheW [bacterium]
MARTLTDRFDSDVLSTEKQEQYATFRLGKEFFGVEVLHVQEILKAQEMTPIPLAPNYVSGLINLRGQIVTAIDLGVRISERHEPAKPKSMNLVVNSSDGVVSLLVDEIGDVLDVEKRLMEPPPPTLHSIKSEYLKGVCKLEGELLLILDVDQILAIDKN